MSLVVVGASSAIAQLALEKLSQKCDPSAFTLVSRNTNSLNRWQEMGATLVKGSMADAERLRPAFVDKSNLLIVSGINIGERVDEHRSTIELAKETGIEHITYTSVAGAHPGNITPSAIEHVATERLLFASGLSFTSMRNQTYSEFYYNMFKLAAERGFWTSLGKVGRTSPLSRDDVAASLSGVLEDTSKHDRVIYEITGPQLLSNPELAEIGNRVFESNFEYRDATPDELFELYDRIGWKREADGSLKGAIAFGSDELVKQWISNEAGYLEVQSSHVRLITGRSPRTLEELLTQWREDRHERL